VFTLRRVNVSRVPVNAKPRSDCPEPVSGSIGSSWLMHPACSYALDISGQGGRVN